MIPNMFKWIFSPSHYDVGHTIKRTSISSITLLIMTRQTNDGGEDPIYDLLGSTSPLLNAPSSTHLVVEQFNDDEEDFLIDPSNPTPLPLSRSRPCTKEQSRK